MSPTENVVRELLQSLKTKNAEVLRPYFSDDIVLKNSPQPEVARIENVIAHFKIWFDFYADSPFDVEIAQMASIGDRVMVQMFISMRNRSSRLTDDFTTLCVFRVKESRIFSWRIYSDRVFLMNQIGYQLGDLRDLLPIRKTMIGEKLAGLGDVLTVQ